MHDDELRTVCDGGPLLWERTVGELVRPCRRHHHSGYRWIGAHQVLAIAPIQLLEDVDLGLGEARFQFRGRRGYRFEYETVLQRCGENHGERGSQRGEE